MKIRRLVTAGFPKFAAVLVAALFCCALVNAQTVATYDFDDGTTDGWTSFNGATTPMASNAEAYTGSYSLLTTNGSTGQGGPSISLTGVLQPGAQYTIFGHVQLTNGESATNANFTIKRSDTSCTSGTCHIPHRHTDELGHVQEVDGQATLT